MTVRENLEMGGGRLDDAEREERLAWLYDCFPILKSARGKPPARCPAASSRC